MESGGAYVAAVAVYWCLVIYRRRAIVFMVYDYARNRHARCDRKSAGQEREHN